VFFVLFFEESFRGGIILSLPFRLGRETSRVTIAPTIAHGY